MHLRDKQEDGLRLRNMKNKIDEIERCVLDLNELGNGVPVIEKNVRSILSFVQVLKFGICDVAEINNPERSE